MTSLIFNSFILSLSLATLLKFDVVMSRTLLKGDVTVVGFFDINAPAGDNGCGSIDVNSVMYAEAVRWYFKQLNQTGDLPISIGLEVFRTCQSDTIAGAEAIKIVNAVLGPSPYGIIAGVIGPETSTGSAVVSRVLSSVDNTYRLAQVGFSATASSLSDMETYPNFFSVTPDDKLQIKAMVKSMLSLEWNRIAVIYEETETGRSAVTELKDMAKGYDICIAAELPINVENGVKTEDINNAREKLLHDTSGHSAIAGYVFFGSKATANILAISLKSSGLSEVPIGMFSSELRLDRVTFLEGGGSRISKTEGSLAVAPPYHVIEEFKDYWMSIFTDEDTFNSTVAENPWIMDVYFAISGCSSSICAFEPLNTTKVQAFTSQPLFVQYAIASAHAYALSIRNVHTDHCGSSFTGMCLDFPGVIASDVFNKVYSSSLDFSSDFSFKLKSLSDAGLSMKLAGNGDSLSMKPSYQLYNFKQVIGGDFDFVKVGSMSGDEFTLDTDAVRDYIDGVTESRWPNVRRGQCAVGKTCSECIPRDLPDRVVHVPGDVYIIGLVPVYDKLGTSACSSIRTINGYQLVEALKHAVDKVNANVGTFSTIFSGTTVGLIAINTCNNPVVAQKTIYDIYENGVTISYGEKIYIKDKIVGFVGDLGSGVSIGVAQVLSRLNFVQISYASTSPLLSDRVAYPYFMRITTPDDAQAKVMIDIVQRLNGDYIQILYSEGTYGEGGLASVEKAAESNKVCVKQKIKVEENGNFFSYYEQLRKFPHARLILVFLRSHVVGPCMNAITEQMSRGEFVFIGSEAWAKNTEILNNDNNQNTFGSFSVVLELAQNAELHTYMTNLQPSTFRENPWSKLYLEAKLNCYYKDSFDKSRGVPCENVPDFSSDPNFSLATWATPAYLSAISLLTGAGKHLKKECGDQAELCDQYIANIDGLISEIKEVQLDLHGFGVVSRVFNDIGDGNAGYVLYNIQQNPSNLQELVYKRVGQYPLQGDPTFSSNLVVSPVEGDLDSRCPNTQACSECFDTETEATTITVVETKEVTDNVRVVLGVFLGLCLLVIVLLIGFITRQRHIQSKAEDTYLHPTERREGQTPEYERPPTVGSHQYISPCYPENFDHINSGEMDEKF